MILSESQARKARSLIRVRSQLYALTTSLSELQSAALSRRNDIEASLRHQIRHYGADIASTKTTETLVGEVKSLIQKTQAGATHATDKARAEDWKQQLEELHHVISEIRDISAHMERAASIGGPIKALIELIASKCPMNDRHAFLRGVQ